MCGTDYDYERERYQTRLRQQQREEELEQQREENRRAAKRVQAAARRRMALRAAKLLKAKREVLDLALRL